MTLTYTVEETTKLIAKITLGNISTRASPAIIFILKIKLKFV